MKRLVLLCVLAAFLLPVMLSGQTASDLNEGSKLEWDGTNAIWRFTWWGRAGRTYFIQQSGDLPTGWTYVNLIEPGADAVKEWGFTTTGSKFFLRLRYSDAPTSDPWNADFDGDGVSNEEELSLGTDPFVSRDSDNDGVPDDWELQHFGNLNQAGSDDPDGDGRSNLTEYLAGTDPNAADGEIGTAFVETGLMVFTPLE